MCYPNETESLKAAILNQKPPPFTWYIDFTFIFIQSGHKVHLAFKEMEKKHLFPFPLTKKHIVVTQKVYSCMDIEKYELIGSECSLFFPHKMKAYIQFNIHIVVHIIYLFSLMVKSQGAVQKQNQIFNRI